MTDLDELEEYDPEDEKMVLSEVLNRILNTGVTISGDLILGIADVDLIYCSVRILLTTVDKLSEVNDKESE